MVTTELHEFHCVIGRGMKKKLMSLDLYKKLGSLSGVVVKILSFLAPVIKKEHKWGEQRLSRYMPVSDDPDEIREHVHVYLPGDVYREVKLLHADLNCFSLAQLVREFLELFLDLVKEYGDKISEKLKKLFKHWEKENKENRLTHNKFLRQLQVIIKHFPSQSIFISIYNRQFSPFWIFHL